MIWKAFCFYQKYTVTVLRDVLKVDDYRAFLEKYLLSQMGKHVRKTEM